MASPTQYQTSVSNSDYEPDNLLENSDQNQVHNFDYEPDNLLTNNVDFLEHLENKIPVLQNEEENSDNFVHKCGTCSKVFKFKHRLKRHIQGVHEEKKPFECPTCSKTFSQKNNLKEHIAIVHEGKKPHKCNICNASFTTKRCLKTHTLAHHELEIPQKCKFCDAIFSKNEALKTQMTVVHERKTLGQETHMPSPVEPYFICTYCNKGFGEKIQLKRHIKIIHAVKKHLKCTSQNSQILHETPTQQTENDHLDKFINCSTCDAPFKSKKALMCHIKTDHSISQENSKQIIRTDNSILPLQNKDSSQVHERKTSFVCQTCAADFKEKRYLLTHVKAIHDKKKYLCTICNKGFAIKGWLKIHHSRVHEKKHEKKTYKCSLCDFECTKKTQMNTHVAFGHNKKKKTFQCTACDYSSSNQSHYIEVAQGAIHN